MASEIEAIWEQTEEERRLVRVRAEELLQKARDFNALLSEVLEEQKEPQSPA
jgi:hypothetical protein